MAKLKIGGRPPAAPPPTREITAQDNERARREAGAIQLRSYIARLQDQAPKTALAKAALDREVAVEKDIMRLAEAAGIKKADLKGYVEDLKKSQRDLIEEERVRTERREDLALPVGRSHENPEIFSTVAERDALDEKNWRAEGKRAGMRFDPPTPPEGIPPQFRQPWTEGYHEGLKIMRDAGVDLPGAVPSGDAPIEPLADQAGDQAAGPAGDGFEATEEELAAQAGRRHVELEPELPADPPAPAPTHAEDVEDTV